MKLMTATTKILCFIFLLNLGIVESGRVRHTRRDTEVDCQLDDDNRNDKLDRCLQKGKKFIRQFFKAVNTNDKDYNFCRQSEKFLDCIEPMRTSCPNIGHTLHAHWRNVIDYIHCVCTDKKTECKKSYDCFFKEYADPLVGRCDDLYNFNTKQGTKPACHFLRENMNCKDALFASGCGELTADFAYHAMKVEHEDFIKTEECHVPREPNYEGFRYTDNKGQCRNFLEELKTCIRDNISRKQTLKFREDNDLVVQADGDYKKSDVKDACSRFKTYQNCLQPINESCPRGIKQVYEFDKELRHYHLKMDYICGEGKKGYLKNVRCYNTMHDETSIDMCNDNVWEDVGKYLNNVTSYQVYCQPHTPNVVRLNQELWKVAHCYEEIANNTCDADSGKTLSKFIMLAFKDPSFLKLDYKADCDLHAHSSTTTISTTKAASTNHHVTTKPNVITPPHNTWDDDADIIYISYEDYETSKPDTYPQKDSPKSESSHYSSSSRHRSSVFLLMVTLLYTVHGMIT